MLLKTMLLETMLLGYWLLVVVAGEVQILP
jgi:hypothetical protein